jgi:hypothetical protein
MAFKWAPVPPGIIPIVLSYLFRACGVPVVPVVPVVSFSKDNGMSICKN